MKRDVVILLVLVALAASWKSPKATQDFAYETLRQAGETVGLTDLRLVNSSTEAAHRMWMRGELRIPDQFGAGAGLVEDFNGDHAMDRALPVVSGDRIMLLVVTPSWRPTSNLLMLDYLTENDVRTPEQIRKLASGLAPRPSD